jgi:hypothetical protein
MKPIDWQGEPAQPPKHDARHEPEGLAPLGKGYVVHNCWKTGKLLRWIGNHKTGFHS